MDNLYKKGKNWYIDFRFHGKRIREMIGPSRKGAEKVIAKRKAEIAENKFLDKREELQPVRFYDFAKEYLQWAKANKKASSFEREISRMRALNKEFETKTLQEITTWQIEKYKLKRKEAIKKPDGVIASRKKKGRDRKEREVWDVEFKSPRGSKGRRTFATQEEAEAYLKRIQTPVRPATVNRELALLKHMYSKAIEWGKVKENPAKKVKLLKGEVKRLRFLMPDEIQKLLENCTDYLKPIVTVAVHTGLRKSELLGLQWDRINFEQGIITLLCERQ